VSDGAGEGESEITGIDVGVAVGEATASIELLGEALAGGLPLDPANTINAADAIARAARMPPSATTRLLWPVQMRSITVASPLSGAGARIAATARRGDALSAGTATRRLPGRSPSAAFVRSADAR
jgi:hypothetical protein